MTSSKTWQATLRGAAEHLRAHDAVLAPIIDRCGPCTITPRDSYYQNLVAAIIGQQLSIRAASSIEQRFIDLFGNTFPTPEAILQKDVDTLRTAGLSRAKAVYIRDLAAHVVDGRLQVAALPHLTNQEVIKELVAVKGIGEWTAHMFLICSLGRLDILPVGDLGIRNGIMRLYALSAPPTPQAMQDLAEAHHWQPYQSVASWYIWQSLDKQPAL